jgi:hypothetical protein
VAGLRSFTYFPDLEGLALDHDAHTEEKVRDARSPSRRGR